MSISAFYHHLDRAVLYQFRRVDGTDPGPRPCLESRLNSLGQDLTQMRGLSL
jgi:hypothetical protein